ncbi:MAG: hypothetical protein WD075_11540 [Rhodospirillales bacterium]
MPNRHIKFLGVFLCAFPGVIAAAWPGHANPQLSPGSGTLKVQTGAAADSSAINVWYHLPSETGADVPVVFIMHGVNRNARDYRDNWITAADRGRFLILAPEFSKADYPKSRGYNLGNIKDKSGQPNPRPAWSFSVIEKIFTDVTTANRLQAKRYDIFGHSAGAQFVHRMLFFLPEARVRRAVFANAGWYTVPDRSIAYPYGLGGAPLGQHALEQAFNLDAVILLGTHDTDPDARHLRQTPEAVAQGPHRLARGQYFYTRSRAIAEALQTPFRWHLERAEGIGHDNAGMVPFAQPFLGRPLAANDKKPH